MLATILAALGNLLGGPFAAAAVNAYKAKLDAENSADATAAGLAAKELALQQREAELQTQQKIAEIGHAWEPDKLLGYIMVIYLGKVIVVDKVIASFFSADPFSTDALKGDVLTWAGWIMLFYVGKRGIENVARIWQRKT